ncbi:MAG: hypothetical protein LC800_05410 [Acidobacteria bacterium]|nr:hypothetical protein [Acidobacteriota bacterium]
MNTQQNGPTNDQSEQTERGDKAPAAGRERKLFVEPVVSVPVDVLEATALFQSPTVDTTATN